MLAYVLLTARLVVLAYIVLTEHLVVLAHVLVVLSSAQHFCYFDQR